MSRLSLLLLAACWAVFAAPALCVAGVLAHACACEEACACDHESDCDTDPCADVLLRKSETHTDAALYLAAPFALVPYFQTPPENPDVSPTSPLAGRAGPGVPHPSDRPLLN